MKKRGQISTEYLIIVSFVVFIVLTTLGIALFYSSQIKDAVKFQQLESLTDKVISLAESVYYSGVPTKTSTTAYMPEGIQEIQILGDYLVFNVSTSSGTSVVAYHSNVNLTGTLSKESGIKKIYLNATKDSVIIFG